MAKLDSRVLQNIERDRHDLKFKKRDLDIAVVDVVLIHGNEKNGGQLWSLRAVERLIKDKNDVVRAAKLKASKSPVERAVQIIYRLELSCDIEKAIQEGSRKTLHPKAQ